MSPHGTRDELFIALRGLRVVSWRCRWRGVGIAGCAIAGNRLGRYVAGCTGLESHRGWPTPGNGARVGNPLVRWLLPRPDPVRTENL